MFPSRLDDVMYKKQPITKAEIVRKVKKRQAKHHYKLRFGIKSKFRSNPISNIGVRRILQSKPNFHLNDVLLSRQLTAQQFNINELHSDYHYANQLRRPENLSRNRASVPGAQQRNFDEDQPPQPQEYYTPPRDEDDDDDDDEPRAAQAAVEHAEPFVYGDEMRNLREEFHGTHSGRKGQPASPKTARRIAAIRDPDRLNQEIDKLVDNQSSDSDNESENKKSEEEESNAVARDIREIAGNLFTDINANKKELIKDTLEEEIQKELKLQRRLEMLDEEVREETGESLEDASRVAAEFMGEYNDGGVNQTAEEEEEEEARMSTTSEEFESDSEKKEGL